ncbi:MAG: ArsR/SmtB family transcription factor [Ignavibacteriaceae bacterium]
MTTNDDNIVKIAKALSDKTRLKILGEIAKKKSITCSEAEKIAGLSQPTVSHHLKILTEAGLLNTVKDGRFLIITVNKKALDEFSGLISTSISK